MRRSRKTKTKPRRPRRRRKMRSPDDAPSLRGRRRATVVVEEATAAPEFREVEKGRRRRRREEALAELLDAIERDYEPGLFRDLAAEMDDTEPYLLAALQKGAGGADAVFVLLRLFRLLPKKRSNRRGRQR